MPWKPVNTDKPKYKRENSAKRGYGDKWRKVRKRYLTHHPVCVECGRAATVVDHIIPHRGNAELMWDENNYQSLCADCHNKKTGHYDSKPVYKYPGR